MSPQDLSGQVTLVTGAAVRTGKAIAMGLAQAGADVIVHCHRNEQAAQATAGEIRSMGRNAWVFSANFEAPDGASELAQRVTDDVGQLDILINNVGNYPVKPPLQHSTEEFRSTMETNLVAPFTLIRELEPLLNQSNSASVINLGYAGAEQVVANAKSMVYQMSKTALLVMTKTLAQELGPRGIRVNMISPGHLDNSVDLPTDLASDVPLQRAGTTDDIVDALLYLLRRNSYVTGVNLEVAGGYRLALDGSYRDR